MNDQLFLQNLVSNYLSLILILLISLSGIFINLTKTTKSSKSSRSETDSTLRAFRLGFPLAIVAAYCIEQLAWLSYSSLMSVRIGLVLFIMGMLLRWTAILSLRESFTVEINVSKNQKLLTTGVYQFIRHPSYTGLLLYYLGLGLVMQNLGSILILFAVTTSVVILRIDKEEVLLDNHFGKLWKAYKARSWRLIPWVY